MNLQPAVGEDDASTWNSSFVFVPAFFLAGRQINEQKQQNFHISLCEYCCDLFWMAFNARLIG